MSKFSCGKVQYDSEKQCKKAIRAIHRRIPRNRRRKGHVPIRAYRCNLCKKWHATSAERRTLP